MENKKPSSKQIMSAALLGLFHAMIQDIPKAKRERHFKKMEWLEANGIIEPVEFLMPEE